MNNDAPCQDDGHQLVEDDIDGYLVCIVCGDDIPIRELKLDWTD